MNSDLSLQLRRTYNRSIRSMILATTLRRVFILAASLVPIVTLAHHAYTAEFDTTKPVKLSGVLTKVEWSNPHIWIYLDVKDDKGNFTNWGFSASPPGMLQRRGITKNSLKLGEVLTISGHRAKDGSNNASGNVVTFADGRDALIGQDQAVNPTEATPSAGKKQ
jgi:hypothetical protein